MVAVDRHQSIVVCFTGDSSTQSGDWRPLRDFILEESGSEDGDRAYRCDTYDRCGVLELDLK